MINFTMDRIPDLERYLSLYYHKIVHVDLSNDKFEIILMRDGEPKPDNENIREWMGKFANDYVHPSDKKEFLDKTSRENFFKALEDEPIDFIFKRKCGNEFFDSEFIFIPDGNTNTTGYVFIKELQLTD